MGRTRRCGRSSRVRGGAAARIASTGDGGDARRRSARSALRLCSWTRWRSPRRQRISRILSPSYRGPQALAHPGLLLRQANRALSENVALGPWVHVSSDVAHSDLARAGDRLDARGRVARLYERKGRGWVDLDLLIVAGGARPIARIRHTTIYRMSALAGSEDRRGGTP